MKPSLPFKVLLFIAGLVIFSSCGSDLEGEYLDIYQSLNDEEISYNEVIRPILSDRCFSCHGPDANMRKAGLRLDLPQAAISGLESGNGSAIFPRNTNKSLLVSRIFSEDSETMMPPPENQLSLTEKEKVLLFKWIEQGAKYEDHWAFSTPIKQAVPTLEDNYTSFNNIDNYIAQKLSSQNLSQSEIASKERLIRRVSMDLTGLPPSIEEIQNFINDNSVDAYEKVVDRLLKSNAYGERMTMEWLDLARYADSHGMHADGYRMMWPWRDWVINAFNKNMPYDEFVTLQIAGDMLPNPTYEQKLATAFNRNHTMTAEGGAIDEEFRLLYVYDRTETFATAFLGLTVGCARCHDHKFDPISQKEFYQMTAFFNNVKELGMTGDDGNYGPLLPIMSAEKTVQLETLEKSIDEQNEVIEMTKQQVASVADFIAEVPTEENTKNRIFYGKIDKLADKKLDNNKDFTARENSKLVAGYKGKAAIFTGEYDELYINAVDNFQAYDPFSASLWINTSKKEKLKSQSLLCTSGNKNNFWRGWEFFLDENNRLNLQLINTLPHNYLHVRSNDSIDINMWHNVSFSYDGSAKAEGIQLYINGENLETTIEFDQLYKDIIPVGSGGHKVHEKKPIRVGKAYRAFTGEDGVFLGKIDEIKIYNKALSALEVIQIAKPDQKDFTQDLVKEFHAINNPKVDKESKKLQGLIKNKFELFEHIDEVMVMEESEQPRKSYVYNRGEYTQPTDRVFPQTPAVLPTFTDDLSNDRLGLSQWLFSSENPLTARVTVNRYWQLIFGTGLVASANDFGLQGSRPSHPKLLDYLAVEFQEHDWDLKWLIKEMVMTYTYRQSSKITPSHQDLDPSNKLLARSPSYRLQAEMIRDNALAASGILVHDEGGESVKPYQPDGLWIEKSSFSHVLLNYKQNLGDSLYRRSLYTFVRRTSPHPAMTIFDAPNREVCTIKRENTNTPLQALVLLNDPQFVEAARVMAERIQAEAGTNLRDQIQYAFRLTTSRTAKNDELDILEELYGKQLRHYTNNKPDATALLSVGDFRFPENVDEAKTAALTSIASTLINHNEAYMKR